jgi:hypothetical protein
MVFDAFDAGRRRLRREHNDRVRLAYDIVGLTRTAKPKPLQHYLIPIDPPENAAPAWKLQRAVERRALAMSTKKRRR